MPQEFASQQEYEASQQYVEHQAQQYLEDLGLDWTMLKDKRVLDVGSGSGEFAHVASKHHVDVISLDVNKEALMQVDQELPKVRAQAVQLPLSDDSMDYIVLHGSAHLIASSVDWPRFMAEAKRVLKPGGELRLGPNIPDRKLMTESESAELGMLNQEIDEFGPEEAARYYELSQKAKDPLGHTDDFFRYGQSDLIVVPIEGGGEAQTRNYFLWHKPYHSDQLNDYTS